MFRGVVSRIAASAVGVQMCAAGVALTDKQLSKKPDWYQKDVLELEESLKKLGRHGFNTSPLAINESHEVLKKYAHISNIEVHWRLTRALVEKSFFTKCPKEKAHLLHEAKSHGEKAISLEGDTHCAGAHKWYAMALLKLDELETKSDHYDKIVKHLEKAIEIDQGDAYSVHLLGVAHYKKKKYAEALSCFEKAEAMKKHFSTCNLYHIGMTHFSMGKKEEAVKAFIDAYKIRAHNEHEVKDPSISLLSSLSLWKWYLLANLLPTASSLQTDLWNDQYPLGRHRVEDHNGEDYDVVSRILERETEISARKALEARCLAKTMLLKLKVDEKDYHVEEY